MKHKHEFIEIVKRIGYAKHAFQQVVILKALFSRLYIVL